MSQVTLLHTVATYTIECEANWGFVYRDSEAVLTYASGGLNPNNYLNRQIPIGGTWTHMSFTEKNGNNNSFLAPYSCVVLTKSQVMLTLRDRPDVFVVWNASGTKVSGSTQQAYTGRIGTTGDFGIFTVRFHSASPI